jgi:hypothetical protein
LPLALTLATGLAATALGIAPNLAEETTPVRGNGDDASPAVSAKPLAPPAELIVPATPPTTEASALEPAAGPEPTRVATKMPRVSAEEPKIGAAGTTPEQKVAAEPVATAPEAQKPKAEEVESAAAPAAVTVRSGQHEDFERFVFDWPIPVAFEVERQADIAMVRFAAPAAFSPAPSVPETHLRLIEPNVVALAASASSRIRSFTLEDHRVVVDVYAPAEPAPRSPEPRPEPPEVEPPTAEHSKAAATERTLPAPGSTNPDLTNGALPLDGDADALVPLGLLRSELHRRDLMIASLLARLETVEHGGPGSRGARVPPPPSSLDSELLDGIQATGTNGDTASPSVGGAWASNNPESEADDPAIVERALERTLTQAGALLLPFGQAEIEPGLSYTRRETSSPVFVTNGDAGVVFIGEDRVERDEVRATLDLRAGLPFDSQIELTLPYNYVDQTVETMVGGVAGNAADGDGGALGNPRIGVAKTLVREAGWRPDVVARAYWDTKLGKSDDDGVTLTGNFNEIGFNMSATKRQDPLAFVGGIGYATVFENNNVEPGDTLSLTAAAVLAASPSTSLRLAFTQQFSDDVKVDGEKLDGSDSSSGVLTIGASSILGPRALVDLALDVGLSDDAPDYAVRLAVPVRFDVPLP